MISRYKNKFQFITLENVYFIFMKLYWWLIFLNRATYYVKINISTSSFFNSMFFIYLEIRNSNVAHDLVRYM